MKKSSKLFIKIGTSTLSEHFKLKWRLKPRIPTSQLTRLRLGGKIKGKKQSAEVTYRKNLFFVLVMQVI